MEDVVGGRKFWADRRVLVTGHTGFKGGWLVLWLERLGARVAGLSLPPPTDPSLFLTAGVEAGMEDSVIGDIRDPVAIDAALERTRPEIVFHLAAQPLVLRSHEQPIETLDVNVMGTARLLDALRRRGGARAAVIVTSDKCYENREWPWGYRETEAMGGRDPYSASKGCAELVAAAFRSSYFDPADHARHGLGVATARAGNVVGGGDWADDRLVPDLVRGLAAGRPTAIRNPSAIRPWQHVLEPLSGYLGLARRLVEDGPDFAEAWNFGPRDEDAQPVGRIADTVASLWNDGAGGAEWERDLRSRPRENVHLKLDHSKATARLGWRPRWDLDTTLRHTIAWYRAWTRGGDMRATTLAQIAEYETAHRKTA